jgi:HD-GYP domain-containing protein (c-di-GMP phosphodiesterase class II)
MMRFHALTFQLMDLVNCIFHALELISPAIACHHNQVAYISQRLCESMGLSEEETTTVALAAGLHDIGAVSLEQSIHDLRFETEYIHDHSIVGATFLEHFTPLTNLAPLVRYHHKQWQSATQQSERDEKVPDGSYIIYLADRVAVMIDQNTEVLSQRTGIVDYVKKGRGSVFHPESVDAFLDIATPEYFWLDVISQSTQDVSARLFQGKTLELDEETVLSWSRFLSRIVDFRSPLNAKHSSGVAASASALAKATRFSEQECRWMLMAGYLHDLGKLSVPTAILEKNGPLNPHERAVINGHTYYTYRILKHVKEFDIINRWAALHHERLDGTGYPFRIPESSLPLGSQIMAVADIFTALQEERTYRPPMGQAKTLDIMYKMARDRAINGDLVRVLERNYDQINYMRQVSQENSAEEYAAMNPLFVRKLERGR